MPHAGMISTGAIAADRTLRGRATFVFGSVFFLGLILALAALSTPAAAANKIGGTLDVDGSTDGINAVGGSITLSGPVDGDVNAVGGSIRLEGRVDGRARLVGGRIDVDATVRDDLSIAGGSVTISGSSRIGEDLEIAAGQIELRGEVEGDAKLASGDLDINARIEGDTDIRGREIRIAPGSYFGGDLTIQSRDKPSIPDSVTIAGEYTYEQRDDYHFRNVPFDWDFDARQSPRTAGLMVGWAFMAGIVLIFVLPTFTSRVTSMVEHRPFGSMLYGIGFLILVPLIGALLVATVIGLPIGIPMLVAYPFLLFFGFVFAGIALSRILLRRQGSNPTQGAQVLALLLVLLGLAVLSLLPLIGSLISLLLLIAGTGAFGAVLLYGEKAYAETPDAAAS